MENYLNPQSQIFIDAPAQTYGSFWERFGAAFIDGLILSIPIYAISFMTGGLWSFGLHDYESGFRFGYAFARIFAGGGLIGIVITWLYYALQESSAAQATVGKRALGLKVIDDSGGRISFGKATGRFFGKYISRLILLIGYLMVLWDDRRQALHDKMAGTLVVKA